MEPDKKISIWIVQTEQQISTQLLPIMEDFYTIQGEGFFQGSAAYFIRLGGCDVGCVWCDVKESWDASKHPMTEITSIVEKVSETAAHIAVITGGEPAMYNLTKLTVQLRDRAIRTHIETSGAYELTGEWDWICLSPKKFKAPQLSVIQKADELKVIVYNKSDFQWGEDFASQVKAGCKLFLQPEWSKEKEMLPLIIEYVKANPKWEVSLQIHKYMNIP
jgi:7-carboxy-7-deazaguanine synthase